MSAAERIDGGGTPSLDAPRIIAKSKRRRLHVNNLWSIWYGITFTGFQAYVAIQLSKRILESVDGVPRAELQTCLILTGLAIVLLPFFFLASVLKIGNLANDGFKIGRTLSTCALDPDDCTASGPGGAMSLWRHGGPTAPFLHVLIAFSLLLPNLLVQARRIQSDDLPRDYIWKSELDFITSQENRPVVLSFTTSTKSIENTTTRPPRIPEESTTPLPQSMMLTSNENEPLFEVQEKWGPVSTEYFNYAIALAVYAVRYPAVFWNTNKYWGIIFSFQLFVNGLQNLLIYVGASTLYKVHVIGPSEVLTQLPSKYGSGFFLLNPHVTLALLVLTTVLVLSSSLVLYLYGYGRFQSFLSHEKACKVISVEGREWGYLTHCAALCVLLAITVVEGPLLVDLAVVYKATMDSAVLIAVVAAVLHLFIWVVLWLVLTLKQNWEFKIRITVGKAAVKSARSIKLLTDVELLSSCDSTAPLLVVASGRTYTVCDTSPKKTIVSAIHKAALERKNRLQGSSTSSSKELSNDMDEQIYWLRPKPISPKNSPDSEVSDRVSWHKKVMLKPRVTFDQTIKRNGREYDEGDDGDYARLRELPLMGAKFSSHDLGQQMNGAKVQYISSINILVPVLRSDYEEPSSLPSAEPPELPVPPSAVDAPATPRCLLRADSGMPHDLTPKSDSEASCSPPDHSETSSGVHSNSSRESHNPGNSQPGVNHQDGSLVKPCNKWQTHTLQRTLNPPVDVVGEVVIRRRVEPETIALANNAPDKFGRSTNMKMTSFTDSQSATLPHFPTQQVGAPYPHCSTMPLPPAVPPMPPIHFNYPRHSTIPTHHNGVHLFTPGHFAKRPMVQRYPHNSFPQLMNPMKYALNNTSERDSANFSMASSGDSDTYHS